MWRKEGEQWIKATDTISSTIFGEQLIKLQSYAKCINASTYSVSNDLNNIYKELHYQHGFYFELLVDYPIIIDDVLFQPNTLYNFSLTHTKNTILNNVEGVISIDDSNYESMTIRTAIAQGRIKASNSMLLENVCGLAVFNAYNGNSYNPSNTTSGTSGCFLSYLGTSGTSLNYFPYTDIILTASYTESDIYDSWNNNINKQGYSLSTYWTPKKVFDKLLNNFKLVDVASTTDINLNSSHLNLTIDGVAINNKHLILLKDQDNKLENGVYYLEVDNFLYRSSILDDVNELEYFSVFVKEGILNKEKSFFIDRNVNGLYPNISFNNTSGVGISFIEGENYVIRNRVDYKLLQNNNFSDIDVTIEEHPILFENELFDGSVNLNGYNWVMNQDGTFIIKRDINLNILAQYGLSDNGTSFSTSGMSALNALQRLVAYDNHLYYMNDDSGLFKLYEFNTNTLVSTEIYSDATTIKDFDICDGILYYLNTSNTVVYVSLTTYFTLDASFFNYTILNLKVAKIDGIVYLLLTTTENISIHKTTTKTTNIIYSHPVSNLLLTDVSCILDSGTSGTSGILNTLKLAFIDLVKNSPIRLEKDLVGIDDYENWTTESQIYVRNDFSKHEINDWKIINQQLTLKNTIINYDTNIEDFPKVSNTIGRRFDGVSDFVYFEETQWTNDNISIEFFVTPRLDKLNTRVFYFGQTRINSTFIEEINYRDLVTVDFYSTGFAQKHIEFISKSNSTNLPRFNLQINAIENIRLDADRILPIDVETKVTITFRTTSILNNSISYITQMWFDDEVVASANGSVSSKLSSINSFVRNYLGKSDSYLDPYFDGEIREFRISDIVLNEAQIKSRYRSISNNDLTYTNLLYYWKLDETNSIIVDSKNNLDGLFLGGLYFQPNLSLIDETLQIFKYQNDVYAINQKNSTSGTSGTSGMYQILKINEVNETIDLVYNTTNPIVSIYVDELTGIPHWLEGDKIYHIANNVVNVKANVVSPLDFVANNNTVYWVDTSRNIYTHTGFNLSCLSSCLASADDLKYLYVYKQTNESPSRTNLYWKDINDVIRIMTLEGINFVYKGDWPFYDISYPNSEKGVNLLNYSYYIVNNQIVRVNNISEISQVVDPFNYYWGFRLNKIFGIGGYGTTAYVGSINTNNEVQIWKISENGVSYNIQLLQHLQQTYIFTSEELNLDLTIESGVNDILHITCKNLKLIKSYVIEGINLSNISKELYIDILGNNQTYMHLKSVGASSFQYTIVKNDKLYISATSNNNISYYLDVMKYDIVKHKHFVGDFGVLFKDTITNGISHNLELKNTQVKFDFNDIVLSTDRSINSQNYIDTTWRGISWIVGDRGQLIKSNDYSNTWDVYNTNISSNLNSIDTNGDNIALIVGDNGTIVYTNNSGLSFNKISIEVDFKNFNDVYIYQNESAIAVGQSGVIVHLSFLNNKWVVDNQIVNTINGVESLDNIIIPLLTINGVDNIINVNFTKIYYERDKIFWLFGDRGIIVRLDIQIVDNLYTPTSEVYNINIIENILDVHLYQDYSSGLPTFILNTAATIYKFNPSFSTLIANSNNYNNALTTLITNSSYSYLTSDFDKIDNLLYLAGNQNTLQYTQLQDSDSYTSNIIQLIDVDSNLDDFFKPKMLILDYYLARKINILLDENSYIVPNVEIDKNILDENRSDLYCYRFKSGEYIEFYPYNQNGLSNYMAFQDLHYTTRRLSVIDANASEKEGYVKVYPYNKRFTAVDDIENYIYTRNGFDYLTGEYEGFNGSTPRSEMRNFSNFYTASYGVRYPESYKHTVITTDDYLKVYRDDVIRIEIYSNEIDDNNLSYRDYILDDKFIIKHVETFGNKKWIVLWDLLPDELLATFNPPAASTSGSKNYILNISNLNYFEADSSENTQPLKALQDNISLHLVGDSYDLVITEEDKLIINAKINKQNKYLNLDAKVTISITEGNVGLHDYHITYNKETVYGQNYTLKNFLKNLSSDFTDNSTFGNIEFSGVLSPLSGVNELSIQKNCIYAGTNHIIDLNKFIPNTFVDLTSNGKKASRIYLTKIEKVSFENEIATRIKLTFDANIQSLLQPVSANTLNIRFRNKLYEISSDLEETDNIHFNIPNLSGIHSTSGETITYYKSYFNQTKNALAYTKILADNELIKKYISALVWIDEEKDLKLNVYNWVDDPNFAFRPLDLHEVGIDYILKKAISVDTSNWDIDSNWFGLKNIDFDKYNFILTDGLSLETVNNEYAWLLNADIKNAIIGLEDKNVTVVDNISGLSTTIVEKVVKWYTGEWHCGVWVDGTFYNGTIYNIRWLNGTIYAYNFVNNFNIYEILTNDESKYYTTWFNGVFVNGNWFNGRFFGGKWLTGNHYNGDWLNGNWLNGNWLNGNWNGGVWENGTWYGGLFNRNSNESIWYNGIFLGGDFENGIWKSGIFDESNSISRFGTKASVVNHAIWEFGIFKNGQFHSGLNEINGVSYASSNFIYSIWKNGIWENGTWYGGTFEFGVWENGLWKSGKFTTIPQIANIKKITTNPIDAPSSIETVITFSNRHYYNTTNLHLNYNNQLDTINKIVNTVNIIGTPNVSSGNLTLLLSGVEGNDNQNGLGWNSFNGRHNIRIIDEYTIGIIEFDTSTQLYQPKYVITEHLIDVTDYSTQATSGCIDENLIIPPSEDSKIYDLVEDYNIGPFVASLWLNGVWENGILENSYWENGDFKGGIVINTIVDDGIYGE